MARVSRQKKSAKGKEIKCGKCGDRINTGDLYLKWTKRHGFGRSFASTTYFRCAKNACKPLASETLSGRASDFARLSESFEALPSSDSPPDTLASALEGFIGEMEELRDEIQEAFDNMPENFQGGSTGEQLETWVSELDDAISEFTDAKDTCESSAETIDELTGKLETHPRLTEADGEAVAQIEEDIETAQSEATSAFENVGFEIG